MLRYYEKRSENEEFEEVSIPRGNNVWLCTEHTSPEDIAKLASTYKLNANILTDVRDKAELPRVEYDDGIEYIFLRTPHQSKKGIVETSPVILVVGKDTFASLFHGSVDLPIEIMSVAIGAKRRPQTSLLLAAVASLVATYETLIKHTAYAIHDTGNRLRTHDVTNSDFIHFVTVEQNLNEYHMNLDDMHSVAGRLYDNTRQIFNEQELEALADIILHIKQLLVSVDTSAKRVESITNAYSTIANNNLNQRMKTLTVLTLLVALPNVFYGMYGMNVALPFQTAPWAYAAVVGFTAGLIFLVYLLAKRSKLF